MISDSPRPDDKVEGGESPELEAAITACVEALAAVAISKIREGIFGGNISSVGKTVDLLKSSDEFFVPHTGGTVGVGAGNRPHLTGKGGKTATE